MTVVQACIFLMGTMAAYQEIIKLINDSLFNQMHSILE